MLIVNFHFQMICEDWTVLQWQNGYALLSDCDDKCVRIWLSVLKWLNA